ncbi:hypothetical protein LCGC14_1684550 [marine sediment metagenome]|uniref:Uncharacterized protein n=1 Tax=marine sediment metagenome TaxID=412755 RepID=A0A0F9KMQ6_9ZZZZ
MKKSNKGKKPNIHAVYLFDGSVKYAVCVWHDSANYYARPLDSNERRKTGGNITFARKLKAFGDFTIKQAYSRATTLFGYAKIDRG